MQIDGSTAQKTTETQPGEFMKAEDLDMEERAAAVQQGQSTALGGEQKKLQHCFILQLLVYTVS